MYSHTNNLLLKKLLNTNLIILLFDFSRSISSQVTLNKNKIKKILKLKGIFVNLNKLINLKLNSFQNK
jgi:hypothetical protein